MYTQLFVAASNKGEWRDIEDGHTVPDRSVGSYYQGPY